MKQIYSETIPVMVTRQQRELIEKYAREIEGSNSQVIRLALMRFFQLKGTDKNANSKI